MLKPNIKMWKHQDASLDFLRSHDQAILNSGMGTGKTLTMLAFLSEKRFNRTLIVTTGKGVDVWKEEIEDRLQRHPKVVDDNSMTILKQSRAIPDGAMIYLTTYARLWREPLLAKLIKANFDIIVLDESHYIAAPNSKVSKAAHKLSKVIHYRYAMTGTLLSNNPLSIFGQARFIDDKMFNGPETPNLLNSFKRFREYFCWLKGIPGIPGAYIVTGYKNMDFYNTVLNRYVYRVESDEVLDLPEAVHKAVLISLPSEARKAYYDVLENGFHKHKNRVVTADNALVAATRLHQIAGGFITTSDPQGNPKDTETELLHTAKLDTLVELVEGLNETERFVVFAKYTEEVFNITARLTKFGGVSILSGQRDELKDWQTGKNRIIVVQVDTGSEAIDLSLARYTFVYSTGWSLGDYEQMLRRMRRPRKDGTKEETVFYYHLLMRGTIDVDIANALKDKKEITSATLKRITGYTK